jgi:acyl carrier protein
MSDKQERLTNVLADHFGIPTFDVPPDARLIEDLGADSLDGIEIAMAIEEEFNIEIDDEKMRSCKTVADLLALV